MEYAIWEFLSQKVCKRRIHPFTFGLSLFFLFLPETRSKHLGLGIFIELCIDFHTFVSFQFSIYYLLLICTDYPYFIFKVYCVCIHLQTSACCNNSSAPCCTGIYNQTESDKECPCDSCFSKLQPVIYKAFNVTGGVCLFFSFTEVKF